jgi:hypothetical protein
MVSILGCLIRVGGFEIRRRRVGFQSNELHQLKGHGLRGLIAFKNLGNMSVAYMTTSPALSAESLSLSTGVN